MKQKRGHFLTAPVLALILLSFFLGTSEFIVVGILPELSEGFDISLTRAGNIVSIFAFTYAIGTPFLAAYAGRFNRYRFMLVSTLIFAVSNLGCAMAPGYGMFLIARIVIAVISGTLISVSMTFAEDISTPENMPKVIAGIFSGFSIASVFGVPIATAVTHTLGWRAAFYGIAAASIILMIGFVKVLPRESSRQRSEKLFHQFIIFKDKRIIFGAALVLFNAAASYTFYTYLTPIFETELRIPQQLISIALLVYGVAALISNIVSGRLAGHGGIKKMPYCYIIQFLCMLFLPMLCTNLVAGAAVIFVLGVMMYILNSPIQLHFLTVTGKDYPDCTNLASSLNSVFFNFGIAIGSACGGAIVDTAGLRYVSIGGAVLVLLSVGACLLLIKAVSHRKKLQASCA